MVAISPGGDSLHWIYQDMVVDKSHVREVKQSVKFAADGVLADAREPVQENDAAGSWAWFGSAEDGSFLLRLLLVRKTVLNIFGIVARAS